MLKIINSYYYYIYNNINNNIKRVKTIYDFVAHLFVTRLKLKWVRPTTTRKKIF